MSLIRVLIADDHAIVREGLRALLDAQPDIEIVGEAENGQESIKAVERFQPDVVLMDITMPGMGGLEATQRIKQNYPDIKILVLTMHDSDEYFFKMLQAGASGYFVKGGSSSELVSAVRAIWNGGAYLYPTMAKRLMGDYLERAVKEEDEKEGYAHLTNREKEVLKLIAEGHTNQEIAESLVLSVATVQTHRARIMAKLGLHRPTELVKYALSRGLISLDTQ